MTAPDDVRARFEAWATDEGYAVERYKDSYQAADTRNAWWGFQAARADLSGEVRELVEADREYDAAEAGLLRSADGPLTKRTARFKEAGKRRSIALAKFLPKEKP